MENYVSACSKISQFFPVDMALTSNSRVKNINNLKKFTSTVLCFFAFCLKLFQKFSTNNIFAYNRRFGILELRNRVTKPSNRK